MKTLNEIQRQFGRHSLLIIVTLSIVVGCGGGKFYLNSAFLYEAPDSERILKERSSNEPKPDKFVFQGVISKQLSHTQVRRWLTDCAKKAGIDGVRGPHDLRHTFITWGLTEFGIDIATMQLIAGHRNLETTQIYVHPTTDHMKDAMRGFGSSDESS